MTQHIFKYYLLSIAFLIMHSFCYAQSVQDKYLNSEIKEHTLNKGDWEAIIDGLDYSEQKKEKEKEEEEDSSYSPSSSGASGSSSGGASRSYPSGGGNGEFWASLFKIIFIIIIAAAIVLLVAQFMGAGTFKSPTNRKVGKTDTKITIDNVEEHIYESDLDRFIREAVEQKKYSLAIRLYYLAIIKELSLNRTINWKKDKTNKDYLKEMRKSNLFQSFREATRIFERAWYGEKEIHETEYLNVKPKFEALVKAAQKKQAIIERE